jgi:alkanesulfonate monooxygenase SsuD/methylene tetrahydromethanopterin reductase-like flavin-dependent oxidoreductase (luciferase family)
VRRQLSGRTILRHSRPALLSSGRIGWNVVIGYLNSAAKDIGLARQPEHDTRYESAEEYMQIVYKLWEGSWEDEAVLRDRARRVFARPEKVHRIQHDGAHARQNSSEVGREV